MEGDECVEELGRPISSLKVTELRDELTKRALIKTGNKKELIDRLRTAIQRQSSQQTSGVDQQISISDQQTSGEDLQTSGEDQQLQQEQNDPQYQEAAVAEINQTDIVSAPEATTDDPVPTSLAEEKPDDGSTNIDDGSSNIDDVTREDDNPLSQELDLPSKPKSPETELTNVLLVQNLVRPFSLTQLRDILTEHGPLVEGKFWVDNVKSKCCVMYENVEVAQLTKESLHGQQWPTSNPRTLEISYITEETLTQYQDSETSTAEDEPENNSSDQVNQSSGDNFGEKVDEASTAAADFVPTSLSEEVSDSGAAQLNDVNREDDGPKSQELDDLPSKPKSPETEPSNILLVQNLVRPFTITQLKDVLSKHGSLIEDKFWIDKVKSKCCVMYESVEVAQLTRQSLHDQQWPTSNPKTLKLSYIDEETLTQYQNSDSVKSTEATITKEQPENGSLNRNKQSSANRVGEKVDEADTTAAGPTQTSVGDKVSDDSITKLTNDPKAQELDDLPSKPKSPETEPSNILLVQNLVRPFTIMQLKDVLSKHGSLIEDKFWIDKVKSKCCVMYESVEIAQLTKQSLHDQQWPTSNPKTLKLSYIDEETLTQYQNSDSVKSTEAATTKEQPENGSFDRTSQSIGSRLGERVDEAGTTTADSVKTRLGEKVSDVSTAKSTDVNRENDISKSQELDDLFNKTKSVPHLFWLPLTESQADLKQKERENREKELSQRRPLTQGHSSQRHRSPPRHRSPRRSPPRKRSHIRRRSPDPIRRSPPRGRSPAHLHRSPEPLRRFDRPRRRSPVRSQRSPKLDSPLQDRRSPGPTRRSPGPIRRSPGPIRRSPGPMRRSPGPIRRSPGPIRRSPGPMRRSPGPIRRSPGPIRRSPGPIRRSPGPIRRSPGPIHRSPTLLRRSPGPIRRSPGMTRRSPATIRRSPPPIRGSSPYLRSPPRKRSPPRYRSPPRNAPHGRPADYVSEQRRLQRSDRQR